MVYYKSMRKLVYKGKVSMVEGETYLDTDGCFQTNLSYRNFKFDKESMKKMAIEAERVFEEYAMQQELKELEEENYYALSEKYKKLSMLELIKMLFI